ncbi:type II toxin-antitoxin system PemK/MazF family toxin [Microcoleus sp. S13_B4]|uniref:type II toxin-antitoxin system PemK/MazF family toxin n=1 Tax=Microcoleus sp. S13_B4 TaxID=3055408 RepID=UPI002FD370FB
MANRFTIRDILLVDFPPQTPTLHEQQGIRPAVVVGRPSNTGMIRFELVIVVPITRQSGDWTAQNPILYPSLQAGVGNLTADSIVLLDQVRAVDIRRVLRYLGSLTAEEYQPIANGLKAMFGF